MLGYKEIFGSIAIFAIICVMVYYTTRFVSQKSAGFMQSKYIKIVDKLIISKDKCLYILQIGTQYFLASSSGQALTVSNALDIEDLVENQPVNLTAKVNLYDNISGAAKALWHKASDYMNKKDESLCTIDELIAKVQNRRVMLKEANNAATKEGQI